MAMGFKIYDKDGAHEEVNHPMELKYMRKVRFRLRLIDSWPSRELGEQARPVPTRNNMFLFLLWDVTLLGQIVYIRNHQDDSFFELGHCYITALMNVIDCQRITIVWTKIYREVTKQFIEEIHLFHHRHMSDFAMEMYHKVNRYCTVFGTVLLLQMISCVFLFNAAPLVANVASGMFNWMAGGTSPENGTYVHSIFLVLPFDYTTKFSGYVPVFIVNCILVHDAGLCFVGFDLHLSLLVFHVWGHLKILDQHLRTFPRPANEATSSVENPAWYTPEESVEVEKLLKQHIRHHVLIMEFVRKKSEAFGPMLATYFMFHQVCDCIMLLEVSMLDARALVEYGSLTLMLLQQLIQLSYVFEFLGSASETLKDVVYGLPWECMGPANRRLVLFYLYNVQEPISLKALGMVPVGVRTMAAILKTSLSYFVMLRTVAV